MRMVFIVFIFLCVTPLPALAQYEKSPQTQQPPPKQQVDPNTPRASIVPGPGETPSPADLPRDAMIDVLSKIDKGNGKEAGHELKKAVEAMQAAADTSMGEAIRSNVLRSVVELSSRVERLHSGGSVTSQEMTPMFSRAMQALAEHHAALAHAHFQNGDNLAAGLDLRASALDANQALVWGSVKATAEDVDQLNQAGRTAKNLIDQKTVDRVGTQKLVVALEGWVHDLKTRLPKVGV